MQFSETLEVLEDIFEKHKVDNRDIQDFRQKVDESIARQVNQSKKNFYYLIFFRRKYLQKILMNIVSYLKIWNLIINNYAIYQLGECWIWLIFCLLNFINKFYHC